jgi:hypothetical protein
MSNIINNIFFDQIVLEIFALIKEKKQTKVLEIINHYNANISERRENIFQIINQNHNNILLLSCIFELNDLCRTIINNYNNLFDLGLRNLQGKTALIICIEKNNFTIAMELLQYRNSLPELNYNTDNIENNTLDLIMSKTNLRFDSPEYLQTLAKILNYYLEFKSTSQILHKNIDKICNNFYLKRMLPRFFKKKVIDFDKICDPIQEADTVIVKGNPNIINTRSVTNSQLVARPMETYIAYTLHENDDDDDGDDHDETFNERMNNRNVRPRYSGGKHTRKKRVKTYASKNKTKSKYRKHRKHRKNKSKRIKR